MNGRIADPGHHPAGGKTSDTPPELADQTGLRRLDAGHLLGGGRECIIVHGGAEYRLRITSNGKLILTK
ncbi:hemin uptake protein HemP [Stella humosa]|uniref:Hemin uptake protein HemP n=1 Tax=Stella humosa TaxID=94 RepID=A0A3N1KZJ4_9PROT|nr:hemin uptake protein HemP [Stella humosa]ROP84209.1 hemin uptake protein HemP [Stella humosa]BBK33721.1 hypothetical protein STHU_43550 [Stella humosa]